MRSTSNKLALICIFLFISFVGSAQVDMDRLDNPLFNYETKIEGDTSKGNFVEMNDGKKIYGDKVKLKAGTFHIQGIIMDGETYLLKDVKGYQKDGIFYARFGKLLLQRVVKGKITVYAQYTQRTYDGVRSVIVWHYIQKGDEPLVFFPGLKEALKHLSECSLSVAMLSISSSDLKKEKRKNPNYVNDAFEIYNNDCKALR